MRKQSRRSTTDQLLCFRYMDSTIQLLPKCEISSLCNLLWFPSPPCVWTGLISGWQVFSERGSYNWHITSSSLTTWSKESMPQHSFKCTLFLIFGFYIKLTWLLNFIPLTPHFYMRNVMGKLDFCICEKSLDQLHSNWAVSCTVTGQLICAFVFNTRIVQPLFFLNPKFQV